MQEFVAAYKISKFYIVHIVHCRYSNHNIQFNKIHYIVSILLMEKGPAAEATDATQP
jgi:hypothetical protein